MQEVRGYQHVFHVMEKETIKTSISLTGNA